MASVFSSLNVGSGLDVRTLVRELVGAERAPRQKLLDNRQQAIDARLSAQAQFRAALDALVGALSSRIGSGALSGIASVSDPSVLTMRVDPGALVARQMVEVRALAQAQTLASAPVADAAAAIGQGQLTIRFGSVGGSGAAEAFDPGPRPDLVVTIGAGDDSLEGIRRAINDAAAVAGAPVQAQIVADASGSRLLLRGSAGAQSGFIVEASGDPGLDALAFAVGSGGLSRTQAAADAELVLDGVTLRRPANAIADLVPGARLALARAAPGQPVVIEAARDPAQLRAAVSDLAGALDELTTIGRELTRGQSATASAGALVADSASRRALAILGGLVTRPLLDGPGPTRLSDIGISVARDGRIGVDAGRLERAVRDAPAAVEAILVALNQQGRPGGPADGPLRAIAGDFRRATQPLGGQTALTREAAAIGRQRTLLDQRMERLEASYTRQFAALDRQVGQARALQSFLTQQVELWTRMRDR